MLSIKKLESPQAFTLIELLVVIAIIGMLAGLFMGVGGAARRKAKEVKAKSMISNLEVAIELYRHDTGIFPGDNPLSGSAMLYTYLTAPNGVAGWYGPYMEFESDDIEGIPPQIMDAWGLPYQYDSTSPPNNSDTFDLWSIGADGSNGTPDDITNW